MIKWNEIDKLVGELIQNYKFNSMGKVMNELQKLQSVEIVLNNNDTNGEHNDRAKKTRFSNIFKRGE